MNLSPGAGMVLFFLTVAAFAAYVISIFNRLITLKNLCVRAWQNIDVLLKQRHDEVPKLVEVCKGSAKFEKETLEGVMRARNAAVGATSFGDRARAEGELSSALGRLLVVSEKYPELKSVQLFTQLQARITELENAIADRREYYNDSVLQYNVGVETFPNNLFANVFGMESKPMFKAAKADREDVEIKLT